MLAESTIKKEIGKLRHIADATKPDSTLRYRIEEVILALRYVTDRDYVAPSQHFAVENQRAFEQKGAGA